MGTTDAQEYVEDVTGETPVAHPDGPVPVEVVAPVRVEEFPARTITTDQVPVSVSVPVRVLGVNRNRASVLVAARGGDAYVGGEQVTPGTGFLIPQDSAVTLEASAALYAVALVAGVSVHVLAQHRDG